MGRGTWRWISNHVGTMVSVIVLICGVAGSMAVGQYQNREQQRELNELKARHATDREAIVEIRTDVRWIRETLDRVVGK